jgi:ligand-binding SRPBCC domain-containing protein
VGHEIFVVVVATSEIVISAPAETVWDVLASIDAWPAWNPDVKWVSVKGDVVEGTQFRRKSGPGTVTSTLRWVERPRLIAWTGRTFGIDAVHVWRLEPQDGATFVRTEESFDGPLRACFRRSLRKTLDATLESGLRHLKIEAERRARL